MGLIKAVVSLLSTPTGVMSEIRKYPQMKEEYLSAMLLLPALYGLGYGILSHGFGIPAVYILKYTLAVLFTIAFSIPTLLVVTRSLGSLIGFEDLVSGLIISVSAASLVAISLLPVSFLYASSHSDPVTMHVISIGISIVVLSVYLSKCFEEYGKSGKVTGMISAVVATAIFVFIGVQFVDIFFEVTRHIDYAYYNSSFIAGAAYKSMEAMSFVR